MVLAAGLGVRMRPITERIPKPLITIGGYTLLDRILDRLGAAGVGDVVVNAYHLAPLIARHVAQRLSPRIHLSVEEALLETGGGIVNALPLLGADPFYAINGDVLWQDGPAPALTALADAWDAHTMDALLLLHPVATALGYRGRGDFHLHATGRLARRDGDEDAAFLFAGLQILHPRLFADPPAPPFSLNVLFDRALATGRLHGVVNGGGWCHVSTPEDIAPAEAFVQRWVACRTTPADGPGGASAEECA
jgi:MurNAc alpha-1-phosphate uridylyltransferase